MMRALLILLALLSTPAWAIDRSQYILGPEPANVNELFLPEVAYMIDYQAAHGMIMRCEPDAPAVYGGQLRKALRFLDQHHFMKPAEWGPGFAAERKYQEMNPAQCQQPVIQQAIQEAKRRMALFHEKITFYKTYQKQNF